MLPSSYVDTCGQADAWCCTTRPAGPRTMRDNVRAEACVGCAKRRSPVERQSAPPQKSRSAAAARRIQGSGESVLHQRVRQASLSWDGPVPRGAVCTGSCMMQRGRVEEQDWHPASTLSTSLSIQSGDPHQARRAAADVPGEPPREKTLSRAKHARPGSIVD